VQVGEAVALGLVLGVRDADGDALAVPDAVVLVPLALGVTDGVGHGGSFFGTATVSTIGVSKVTDDPCAGFIAITWPTLKPGCTSASVGETRSQPAFCSLIRPWS
jgi:hypothetical protein